MDWKDVEVGDVITIEFKSRVNPHIISGEITQIRHYNRQTDPICDPLVYYISDDYYEFRIIIQKKDGLKEYALNSLFWRLINIQKKGETTMPLEIGKKYKVNIPQDWQNPSQREFTGELIAIQGSKILTHLVYSEELDNKKYGHCGFKEFGFGHWWCDPKWLTPVEEPTKETIKLEDIFNE